MCLVTDVTTMKNQQQELWLTKRKLEGVLDQAGVQSWDWDISSNRLVLSRSELMERIFACLLYTSILGYVFTGFEWATYAVGITWLVIGLIIGAVKSKGYKEVPEAFKNLEV